MKRDKINTNNHGVITVFISFMLVGIIGLSSLVLEGGRLQAAKSQLDEANGSAGYSMIAAYNGKLYDRFGILAIDEKISNLGSYRSYLDFNSDLTSPYEGNNISTLYTVKNAEMQTMYNLTYPSVLKRQILSRAKYNVVPQNFYFNYYNMEHFLEDFQKKLTYITDYLSVTAEGGSNGSKSDIPANMQDAFANMYDAFKKVKKYDEDYGVNIAAADTSILPSATGTVESVVNNDDEAEISAAVNDAYTVIGSEAAELLSGGGSYTETDASVDVGFIERSFPKFASVNSIVNNSRSIISDCRQTMQRMNSAFNALKNDAEGNLLLNSFISEYFSNKNARVEEYAGPAKGTKGSINTGTFVSACTEYVFAGNSSETANQAEAYNYIMAMRLVNNLYNVLVGSNNIKSNNAVSVAAHIVWAYYESFIDAELLLKYNAVVPFAKYNMIMPINNVDKVKNAFTTKDFLNAMQGLGILVDNRFIINGSDDFTYTDALAIALWFVPNSKKLLRTADLIQLEMRYRENYMDKTTVSFLMEEQNTFCRVKCAGTLNSILPVISTGEGNMAEGVIFESIRYVGY